MLSDDIIKLARQKIPQKTIAERLNCSVTTVRRYMKKAGLKGQSKGERSFVLNSHIFDTIDVPEKAYWLGFMLADGCIAKSAGTYRTIRVSLQKRDEGHLRLLADFLGYKGEFFDDLRDNHPRKVMVFNDVIMTRILLQLGWLDYKNGINFEIINTVPDFLLHHFVRGYFDGDGCISSQKRKHRRKRRWYSNIVCKFDGALNKINCRIAAVGGPFTQVKPRKSVYELRWANRGNVAKFGNFIYSDNSVRLERKYTRWLEFQGLRPFVWNNIHDFEFKLTAAEIMARTDRHDIINEFVSTIISSGWQSKKFDCDSDWLACQSIDIGQYLGENQITTGLAPGNQLVLHHQPLAYHVRQGGVSVAELAKAPKTVARAVKAFITPGKTLSPARLIRELRFAGLTMASMLSVPVIIAALKHFGLQGKWFDPCAGWGHRLLAAKIAGCDYEATDPGISYPGLVKIKEFVGSSCQLHNLKWQDVIWSDVDFVLTSPPFHNKEDYLDGVEYGKFETWYAEFLRPLVQKAKTHAKRVVLHVDKPMKNALTADFIINALPLVSRARHKAPNEWFVEICAGR